MSTKANKLNTLIENLEICTNGKIAVRKLVAEITGENLEAQPKMKYKIGQRFSCDAFSPGAQYILACCNQDLVGAVNLSSGLSASGFKFVTNKHFITPEELASIFGQANYKFIG